MLTKPQTEAEPLLKAEEGVTKEDVPKTGRKTLHKLAGALAFVGLFACGAAVMTGHAGSGLAPMSLEGGGRGATPRSWRKVTIQGEDRRPSPIDGVPHWEQGPEGLHRLGEPRIMKDGSKACVGENAPYRALYITDKLANPPSSPIFKIGPTGHGRGSSDCNTFMGSGESKQSDWSKRVKLENGNVKVCKNGKWLSANIPGGKKAMGVTSSTDGKKIVAVTNDEIWVYGCFDYYGACDAPGSTCSASSSSYSDGSFRYYGHAYSGGGYAR